MATAAYSGMPASRAECGATTLDTTQLPCAAKLLARSAGPLFISEPYPYYRELSAQNLCMLQRKGSLEDYEYQ